MNCQVIAKINVTNKTFLYHTTKYIKEPKSKCFLKNAGDEIYELVISDNNDDN